MSVLTPERFAEYYRAICGKASDPSFGPFPWQERVAVRACSGNWPKVIALPTAAGKTACIDIAVFALACRSPNAPRRVFFVVDRRIVVDQAWLHAKELAKALNEAETGILREVANVLREVAQDESPLDVYALRGGMYRETAWARSPLQPAVVAATVDQVGSRLLFRGYGVSDSMKPIHAGLVGNDSIILLDEAHCSKPFEQTMEAVETYRRWGSSPAPFHFVSMTATPRADISENEIERDRDDDRAHAVLGARLAAKKPAVLDVAEKAKGKNAADELVKRLDIWARKLATTDGCVGVIVNRVATARSLKRKLAEAGEAAVLLTGRMRPLDRDRLFDKTLRPLLSNGEGPRPRFVVATQCIEVGADFDFHALVTECASLDALRQRFGRLNRVARRETAHAVIVVRGDQTEPKENDSERDPIYANSLPLTWKWMNSCQDGKTGEQLPWIDFGVASVREKWDRTPPEERADLNSPAPDAPSLLPVHLDCWIQTSPIPTPDPDPAVFLHGVGSGEPDIQVVFRDDLGPDESRWTEIVSLCPPSSSEAVPVRIGVFKEWLRGRDPADASGDVEGESDADRDGDASISRRVLRWQGPGESRSISDASEVLAGAVYVVPVSTLDEKEAAGLLGDFPFGVNDLGDEAFQRSRDRAILRLKTSALSDEADDFQEQLTDTIRSLMNNESPESLSRAAKHLSKEKNRWTVRHPLGGWVATGKRRLGQFDPEFLDDSESSYSPAGEPVELAFHSVGVAGYARCFADACGLEANAFELAGTCHDLGKLDPRFQRLLKGHEGGPPLAKSGRFDSRDKTERQYPVGGRHELLSAAMVRTKSNDDLLLHLIATHHGSARPFAKPIVENGEAKSPFAAALLGIDYNLASSGQDVASWNAELPERFWRVVRRYGWWGVAYREAVFRLADHAQSRDEQDEQYTRSTVGVPCTLSFPPLLPSRTTYRLPLAGLDGSNPLAFLTALGTLVVCDRLARRSEESPQWLAGTVALSWGHDGSFSTPVLHLPAAPESGREFVDFVSCHLSTVIDSHPAAVAVQALENGHSLAASIREICRKDSRPRRDCLDWIAALICESSPGTASQLQTVRRDYLPDNLRSIMKRTKADHLNRALFKTWDFADALDNQSLHWEPTEDRRYAYQWNMPSGDPTRKKRGGMLGANRLALEAWTLFPLLAAADHTATRGFRGKSSRDTYWTWPLWRPALNVDTVASFLSLPDLQQSSPQLALLEPFGVTIIFRGRRILVGKTPNLTQAVAIG